MINDPRYIKADRIFVLFEDKIDSKRFFYKVCNKEITDVTPDGELILSNVVLFRVAYHTEKRFFVNFPSTSLEETIMESYKKLGASINKTYDVSVICFESGLTDSQFNDRVDQLITFMEL